MTALQMQKYMQQQLSGMDVPFQSEDLMAYINKAIHRYIVERFNSMKNQVREGFEQSPKRVEDLRELIVTDEIDTTQVTTNFISNIKVDKAPIPENHFLLLSVGLKVFFNSDGITNTVVANKRTPSGVLDTDYGQLYVSAKFIQHDDIYTVLSDPFNKPRIQSGIYTIDDGDIYSYTTDEFITDKVVITYIKEPAKVSVKNSVDCDLSSAIHEDIVDLAVTLFAQDKGQAQSQPQQQQN